MAETVTKAIDVGKGLPTGEEGTKSGQTEINQKRHTAINEICKRLSVATTEFADDAAVEVYKKILEYRKEYKRWFYSDISNYLFTEKDPSIFLLNLEKVQAYADRHLKDIDPESNKEEYMRAEDMLCMLDKLWDHSNLAQKQISVFKNDEEKFKIQFETNMKPYKAEIFEEINKQVISLIAIFTALSFLVFGGISSLDNIFEGVSRVPIIQLMIVGCIWCLCILNLIFVFIYFISKITKMPIASTEKSGASLFERYPFWIWSNYVMLLILVLSCWISFIEYGDSGQWLVDFSFQHSTRVLPIGTLLILLVFGFVAWCLGRKKNSDNK